MGNTFNTLDKASVGSTIAVGIDSAGDVLPAGLQETIVKDANGLILSITSTDGVNTWVQTVTRPNSTTTVYGRPVKQ